MKYGSVCLVFFVALTMAIQSSSTEKKNNLEQVEPSKKQSCWTNPASIPGLFVFLTGLAHGYNTQAMCRFVQVSNSEQCQDGEFSTVIGMPVFVSCLNVLGGARFFPKNTFMDPDIPDNSDTLWILAKQHVKSWCLYGAGFALGHTTNIAQGLRL